MSTTSLLVLSAAFGLALFTIANIVIWRRWAKSELSIERGEVARDIWEETIVYTVLSFALLVWPVALILAIAAGIGFTLGKLAKTRA